MPDSALYWYGNECVEVTGGFGTDGIVTKNTNNIFIGNKGAGNYGVYTQKLINISNYSKVLLKHDCTQSTHTSGFCGLIFGFSEVGFKKGTLCFVSNDDTGIIQGVGNNLVVYANTGTTTYACIVSRTYFSEIKMHALWLE